MANLYSSWDTASWTKVLLCLGALYKFHSCMSLDYIKMESWWETRLMNLCFGSRDNTTIWVKVFSLAPRTHHASSNHSDHTLPTTCCHLLHHIGLSIPHIPTTLDLYWNKSSAHAPDSNVHYNHHACMYTSGGSRIVERGVLLVEEGLNCARKRARFFEPHPFFMGQSGWAWLSKTRCVLVDNLVTTESICFLLNFIMYCYNNILNNRYYRSTCNWT